MLCIVNFLLYASFVQCLHIAACIGKVLGIGTCKVVGTGKVFLGAHVEIVVLLVVQDGIYGLDRGDADGTWGKPRDRKSVV